MRRALALLGLYGIRKYIHEQEQIKMASVVKKNPTPEKKAQLTAQEKKAAKKQANDNALCWTQEPSRKRSEDGAEQTLNQYLTTELHKRWGLKVEHLKNGLTAEQIGGSHKDKRLTDPCKDYTGSARVKFCINCRRKTRKMQLKINNETLADNQAKGKAGHHKQYRGKPTEAVLKLKKLGEDPEKRIKQGEPLPKTLAEKLASVELGEKNPAKAAAKKPVEKKGPAPKAPKAAKEAAASMRKAMKKTAKPGLQGVIDTANKVKQGPLSKPKKVKKDQQPKLPGMEPDPALMAAAATVPAAQVSTS
jgi:hypothetical protein